jgi:hypothetical protein
MLVKDPPYPTPCRVLIYDGVELQPAGRNAWRLPGTSTVASTTELYDMARKAGVWCVLFERTEIEDLRNE